MTIGHRSLMLTMPLALLLGGLLVAGGCASDPTMGYSAASLYREDIATVAVPILDNNTYHREIQFELTDAIIKEIETRTPYRVAPPGLADTILQGTIQSAQMESLSKSRLTGGTEEQILSVTLDFQWKDLRSDRTIIDRRGFAAHGLFVPAGPTQESIEVGQWAVVQTLARDIVAEMRSGW